MFVFHLVLLLIFVTVGQSQSSWLTSTYDSSRYEFKEHGSFNNITLTSNCSATMEVALRIAGQDVIVTVPPHSESSTFIVDNTCRNYYGFRVIKYDISPSCSLGLSYQFVPCGTDYLHIFNTVLFVIYGILILVLIMIVIAFMWAGIKSCLQDQMKKHDKLSDSESKIDIL